MIEQSRNFFFNSPARFLAWVIFFIPIFDMSLVSETAAQDQCETVLAEAQKMFDVGRSVDLIDLLTKCLPNGIPEIERVRAYKLLALAYILEDRPDKAKDAIEKLLDLDPIYKPDPVQDLIQFAKLVEEAKQRRRDEEPVIKKLGRKRWFWIGGGGLVAAGVVAALISEGSNTQQRPPLAGHPDLPGTP